MADDVLGIILARKGSKRLPGKNNARVNGVKLIDVLIKNANNAGISDIWLCTNDPELQGTEGVKIIPRPAGLSGDDVTSEEVIYHILSEYDTSKFKYFCLLQVTAPFFNSADLAFALNVTREDDLTGFVSVTPAFKPSGNFYIINSIKFRSNYIRNPEKGLWIPDLHIAVLPWEQCIDIDHIYDLRIAQAIYKFERKEPPKTPMSKTTHGDRWKDNWTAPDLTPQAGETLVTTKYGWAVQHPEHLTLGKYVDIGYGTYINARFGVRIGDDVEIGGGCHIYSHNTIDEKFGIVILEEGCQIGAHCVIMPGVTIGKGAVVGAMSLVKKDVAAGSTVVGVPARRIDKIIEDPLTNINI